MERGLDAFSPEAQAKRKAGLEEQRKEELLKAGVEGKFLDTKAADHIENVANDAERAAAEETIAEESKRRAKIIEDAMSSTSAPEKGRKVA